MKPEWVLLSVFHVAAFNIWCLPALMEAAGVKKEKREVWDGVRERVPFIVQDEGQVAFLCCFFGSGLCVLNAG